MKSDELEDTCLDHPIEEIWSQAKELLQKRLSHGGFTSWIKPLQLLKIDKKEATVAVKNDFTKSRIVTMYAAEIQNALQDVLGRKITLKVAVDASLLEAEYTPSIASIAVLPPKTTSAAPAEHPEITRRSSSNNLNPKHLFETFVVGSSNRFSHAAALSVAEKPGQAYNPLFLYGGVGLGKTHLLHAIGNAILNSSANSVVRYMSCEKFTNEVIESIRLQKMPEFRKRYRQIDVLLMDDIQFIEGKEQTQEEFFHTFNHLRDNGKQIVLSSDRPPKALSKLAERLRSRFEWGLIADIQAPEYEMRLAILRKKAEAENKEIPDDVLEMIASTFTNNIRELEGALLRAHALASLTGVKLTAQYVKEMLLGSSAGKDKRVLTVERVIEVVSAYYRVEPGDLRSAKRSQDLTVPRHIAMYLAHEILSLSFPRVGQAFGNRKHTSALYAYDKIKQSIAEDLAMAETIRQITRQLDN